jgi:cell wall-associated NlpC family hydrolase
MNRRLQRSARALVALAALAGSLVGVTGARADGVSDQQHKVEQLAAELNSLNDRIGQLDEQYGAALEEKDALDGEIAKAQATLAVEQGQLDQLQGVMTDIAVEKFVGNNTGELSPLFSSAAVYSSGEQKDALSNVAFDTGAGSADDLQSLIRKVDKDTKSLQRKEQRAQDLIASLAQQKTEAEGLVADYTKKAADAKAKYGELVQQEADRQAEIAADRAAARAAAASQAQNNSNNSNGGGDNGGAAPSPRGGGGNAGGNAGNGGNAGGGNSGGNSGGTTGGGTKPPLPVPPPSGRAGIAVQAAYSVIGTPYVAFAASPDAGFDCSGLTQWAWGQAGVGLPHYSKAQFNSFPHVPQSNVQPGDLVFYYSPISHVGMYVGGGMMIDSPHTGATVRLKAVRWSAVVGVSRPG